MSVLMCTRCTIWQVSS